MLSQSALANGECPCAPQGWLLAGPLALGGRIFTDTCSVHDFAEGVSFGHGVGFPCGAIFLPPLCPHQTINHQFSDSLEESVLRLLQMETRLGS